MRKELLIVDDKVKICESLSKNFSQYGFKSYCATKSSDALEKFQKHPVHAVILDIVLNNEDGVEILRKMQEINSHVPVIMITAYASIENAVKSIKLGAYDYLQKPIDFDKLLNVVENAIKMSELKDENKNLITMLRDFSLKIITQNSSMIDLMNKAKRIAATDIPVLIYGENGTGKELLADFIHVNSPRVAHTMVKMNCACLPEHLMDNELFGHEREAFTGAYTTFKGVFERAHNSTIFLDEIGDMSPSIQAKILRALQNQEIRRLGGTKTIKVNVRFIAATNKDLKALMTENKFREDLFYRLNAASIALPPLRSRRDDIPYLVSHFTREFANINEKQISGISDLVMDKFMSYNWPGNIRELRNTIHYTCAITSNNQIGLEDLPTSFIIDQEHTAYAGNIREETERGLILSVLRQNNHNKKKTAEILKMTRRTLYTKLGKYGIANEPK